MRPAPWCLTAVLGALYLTLQLAAVLNPEVAFVDMEERFNPLQSMMLVDGHWGALFHAQYRHFCGGCTADALLGAAVFTVLPPTWMAWKLVPIGFGMVALLVGHRLLYRLASPWTAGAYAALLICAPYTWLALSLIGWGNHYEVGTLVVVAVLLLAAERPSVGAGLGAGALLGLSLWIGFSAAFAVIGCCGWLVLRRRWGVLLALAPGLLLAVGAWTGQYLTSDQIPFATIYQAGEAKPDPTRIPAKLVSLFAPRQLAGLFGFPSTGWGHALGWGMALSLGVAVVAGLRRGPRVARGVLLLMGVWLGIYVLVRFTVTVGDAPPSPPDARYAAPLYPLVFVLLAVVAGRLWAGQRRAWALALLAFPLGSGLAARAAVFGGPFPVWTTALMDAVEYDFSRGHFASVLHVGEHARCSPRSERMARLHAYAQGRAAVTGQAHPLAELTPPSSHRDAWEEGVGEALLLRLNGGAYADNAGVMAAADELVQAAPALEGGRWALRAVAWGRRNNDTLWQSVHHLPADGEFAPLHAALVDLSDPARDASWWAIGRRFAFDRSAPFLPAVVRLPELGPAPDAFIAGVGFGMGERWGPLDRIPRPVGLSDEQVEVFVVAYREGRDRQWWGVEAAPAPTLVQGWSSSPGQLGPGVSAL